MTAAAEGLMGEGNYRRGTLEPVWGRLQAHEHDIRELYRHSAQAHERVNATNEALLQLRDDIRDWKNQTHRDSSNILQELRASNARAVSAEARSAEGRGWTRGMWDLFKVGVPIVVGATGLVFGGFTLLYKFGVIG